MPNDKHRLRSLLGLCTYYMRFISGFTDLAKPLTKLTEDKRTFEWSAQTQNAFQTLKEALCTALVLGYPRSGERFIIETDARNVGIGSVLSQVQDRAERLIPYFSKPCPRPKGTIV